MTDRYAVIGQPVAQSRSPQIHRLFAEATRQDIDYGAIASTPDAFERDVRAFIAAGGRGMNVTMPFKLQAHALCDERSPAAVRAGAVNALRFDRGRIEGENFDGTGVVDDIERNLHVALRGRRVLLLGAGGAARGAAFALAAAGPALLYVANRSPDRAHALAADVAAAVQADAGAGARARTGTGADPAAEAGAIAVRVAGGSFDALEDAGGFDVVLNATASSMDVDGAPPPVPASAWSGALLAYDMVYGKGVTPFLRAARDHGVRQQADGVGMLVEQAARSFTWWRGVPVDTRAALAALASPAR